MQSRCGCNTLWVWICRIYGSCGISWRWPSACTSAAPRRRCTSRSRRCRARSARWRTRLGVVLFARSRRRVELTPEGTRLLGEARRIARPARAHRAGGARHGARRGRAAAHRLRLARRLRRAARAAEGVQVRAPRHRARAARDALARAGGGARRRRARLRPAAAAGVRRRGPRAHRGAARALRRRAAGAPPPRRGQGQARGERARRRAVRHGAARHRPRLVRYRHRARGARRHFLQRRPGGDPDADRGESRIERAGRGDRARLDRQSRPARRGLPRARRRHPRLDLWLAWPRSGLGAAARDFLRSRAGAPR